jgi:hypothetical protein
MIIRTHKEQINTTYSQHVCPPPTFEIVILLKKPSLSHIKDLKVGLFVMLITFSGHNPLTKTKTNEHQLNI